MNGIQRVMVGVTATMILAAAPSTAQAEYLWDDGTSESAISVPGGTPKVTAWMQWFDVTAGMETITHISTAFGTPAFPLGGPLVGRPFGVGIWVDPNGDGDPSDFLSFLSSATSTVGAVDSDAFQIVDIPDVTLNLGDRFFIAAWMEHPSGTFPGPIDQSQNSNGRAWFTGEDGGVFNPLGFNPAFGWLELDSVGGNGVFLLRATAIPTPGALALLGVAGVVTRRRRRR